METVDIMLVIVYGLLSVLIITLVIFVIKLFGTLKRLNTTLDEVNGKVEKLSGLFNIIDNTTDYISVMGDKIADKVSKLIGNWFSKKNIEGEDKNE